MATFSASTAAAADRTATGLGEGHAHDSTPHGWRRWLYATNHKDIGTMYLVFSLTMWIVGGAFAMLIRLELFRPGVQFFDPQFFNSLTTVHGLTMIFGAIMPAWTGFANWMIPLQIGAPDMALPRLNNFSFWILPFAFTLLLSSLFVPGGAPAGGWTMYPPLVLQNGASFPMLIFSIHLMGASSILGAINVVVTIMNLRAPGMTLLRMPLFVWTWLITAYLLIAVMPVLAGAVTMLLTDHFFGTTFFTAAGGGDPVMFQHIFWFFGHPEVYILILPAFGIVSEIIPTFSRKPLFGYPIIVFSGVAIGFIGFGVWSHHMFTTGLGNVATAAFALATMAIAVPTGVKIFNWIGTLWGGQIQTRVPMMFALGFIWMFMLGGFSGIMHSAAPADAQQQDSYFVIAHFHYVLIGGATFALLAAIHYWFPKFFGRMVPEFWGKLSFWLIFIGFNCTFFPMHFLGLNGMPRRTWTYDANMGWNEGNLFATCGAYLLGLGIFTYFAVLVWSFFKGKVAGNDPWDGRTMEWSIPSPPPEHNFAAIPTVHARDAWWYEKHHQEEIAAEKAAHIKAEESHGGIHMPDQSWYPIISAFGLLIGTYNMAQLHHPVVFFGNQLLASHLPLAITGLCILVIACYLWSLEGPGGYHLHIAPDGKVTESRRDHH